MTTATATFPAPTTTVHLQCVGEHHALRATELFVGCVTVWNHGGLEVVTRIEQASKCYFNVSIRPVEWTKAGYVVSEKEYVRRMKTSRTVGYSPKATAALATQTQADEDDDPLGEGLGDYFDED